MAIAECRITWHGKSVNNEADVVGSGSVEHPRRAPKLIAIAVSLLVVAGFVGADADRSLRHHEFASLVATSIDGRATAQHAEAVVESTRAYTMPLLGSAQPDVRAGLAQLIADSASQGVDAVRAARAKVAGTVVLPWHGSLRIAKADELRYLDAWATYLDTMARGGTAATGTLSALDADFVTTASALRAAAPNGGAANTIPADG